MELLEKTSTQVFNKYYRYNHSEKGRARRLRFYNTPWGYAHDREKAERAILSGESAKWHRERYHEIQEEAGCYHCPDTFYPAYRFIKALETAEIVEI